MQVDVLREPQTNGGIMMTKMCILFFGLSLIFCGCGKANGYKPTERRFPSAEQSKVDGKGYFFAGDYHATIYNGSAWTITRIVLTIEGRRMDANRNNILLWTRDFSAYPLLGRIRSLTTETCIVNLPDYCDGDETKPLAIKEVYGYRP